MRTGVLVSVALFAFLSACDGDTTTKAPAGDGTTAGAEAGTKEVGEILATVDGVQIGSSEYQEVAARKSPAAGDKLSDAEKTEVMDRLIEEKLLYEAALKKGLDKDPKVQKVMVNSLLRDVVYNNVRNSDFTDEALQKYYDAHKEDFVVPEKVQIGRILIKITDERPDDKAKAEASRIKGEIGKKPDSFKDLAAQFSEDPYRRRGGDVGFVPVTGKPGLDPDVVKKAFEIPVDSVSDVFKTSEGYNIIQVSNKRERVERTFQQMKGSVLRKVKNEKLKELYDKYVADLKAAANIKVEQDKLTALEIKSVRRPLGPGFVSPDMEDGPGMGLEGDGIPTPPEMPTPGEPAAGGDEKPGDPQ